jgi:hypothetical protein
MIPRRRKWTEGPPARFVYRYGEEAPSAGVYQCVGVPGWYWYAVRTAAAHGHRGAQGEAMSAAETALVELEGFESHAAAARA